MAVDFTMLNRILGYKLELDQVNRLIEQMESDEQALPVQIPYVLNDYPYLTDIVGSATDELNTSFLNMLHAKASDLENTLSRFTITEG